MTPGQWRKEHILQCPKLQEKEIGIGLIDSIYKQNRKMKVRITEQIKGTTIVINYMTYLRPQDHTKGPVIRMRRDKIWILILSGA